MVLGLNWALVALVGVIVLIVLVLLAVIGRLLKLWIMAYFACAGISIFDLIGMSLRKVDPQVIVMCKIRACQAGLDVSTQQMERHYLAGGSVPKVVTAMTVAAKAGMQPDWELLTAVDLAGRDVIGVVNHALKLKDPGLLRDWDKLVASLPEGAGREGQAGCG